MSLRPWRKDATQCWLCTDRPTQHNRVRPLRCRHLWALYCPPTPIPRNETPIPRQPVSASACLTRGQIASAKNPVDPRYKKKPRRSPAQPSSPHFQQQGKSCVFICLVYFYEGNSCHVWTRRPVGCCKTKHAEVLKSDTSVDSSSSRRRRLVCRDCGREGRQTVCDHQRCWLPKFDVFDAPQTQKIKP